MPSRISFHPFLRFGSLATKSAPQQCLVIGTRGMSSSNLNRPSPPPLPRELQREFEELQRSAQMPLSSPTLSHDEAEAQMSLHPDARKPLTPEFEGGPKREPVGKWSDDGGDWSFKGRVSDF
ncbi:hypothetical protein EDB19DRAFT_1670955 [Suillus lakei]|nr:hypothetical protein EDB19DRAFT_1670955 [Suillus lakei]